MNKEEAVKFAGLMESYLNIPSCVCEMIEKNLMNNKYKEVIEYVIQRRNELENKENYISYFNLCDMYLKLQQENKEQEEYIKYWQNEYDKKVEVIDKAIEYLEYCLKENCEDSCDYLDNTGLGEKLLEILKGDSNE